MRASGLVLWGSLSALAFASTAGGCGGRAELGVPDHGGDDGGSSGSSSGVGGSSSGFSGSSSGFSGSSSGFSGSGSGMDGSSSGSGSGSSSGFSGSSSGISGSSSGVSGSSSGGSPNGTIYLEECSASFCGGQVFSVYAAFFSTAQGNGGCTITASAGSCAYYMCPTVTQQNGDNAGPMTVSGPWLTAPLTILAMNSSNAYEYSSSSPGYTSGQTLTVSAAGATVPAFGPESVVAPQLTQLTSPAISPDGGTTDISTATDLQITWSGGQTGATMLFEASAGNDYTYCEWNASDGQGTVPAATLKPLSGVGGYLIYGQYESTSFFAGPYAISLTALPYTGSSANFQ